MWFKKPKMEVGVLLAVKPERVSLCVSPTFAGVSPKSAVLLGFQPYKNTK